MKWLLVILLLQSTALAEATHKNVVSMEDVCMASALHYESRGSGLKGMRAVYESIKYRASKRGLSICQTLRQRYQYSWMNKGDKIVYNEKHLTKLAEVITVEPVGVKADYFFSGSNVPKWAKDYKYIGEYGGNKFYQS